jgi:threonine dehydratase
VTHVVTEQDVEAAAARIRGQAVQTPLLEVPALNRLAGRRVLLKAETLQHTGSFKFRGGYNKLSQLPRGTNVVAYSSGNHAQAVACASHMLGHSATIVMPIDAPLSKTENTRGWGARVVQYDRVRESREDIAFALASDTGAVLVKPYDDLDVIAGQGTVGLEIREQAPDAEAILVCCGGGGLSAGIAVAVADTAMKVYCVEPESHDDTMRSLEAGTRVFNDPQATSICDALLAPTPGEITFELNRRLLSGGFSVSDDQTTAAMRTAFQHAKLVTEPGGAVALAAVLAGFGDADPVVAVLSGGNVDWASFRHHIGD